MDLEEIKNRYGLTLNDIEKIRTTLLDMKLSDILFSYPSGPRREVAEYLMRTSR